MINETNNQTVNLTELINKVNNLDALDNDIRDDVIASLKTLQDYLMLQSENRLIKTNAPVGTIVYLCSVETVQRGLNATDENPGGEEENLPVIIQKPFIPSTMYFDMLNNGYGQFVFGDLHTAIKFINDKMGLDVCRKYNFPTIEQNSDGDEVIYDNGTDMIELYSKFDSRLTEEFLQSVIHCEVSAEDFLGINYTPMENPETDLGVEMHNECVDDECAGCECDCFDDCPREVSPHDEDCCNANCEECNG